ncbi:helix-turn-helix domain-containing protein [Pseudohalocynthiibacter sp. F2068]|jgi:excisionase family DNA binding protein|uniref:helix-turn-helix domain-containing protein n=1 Tax=Pseudohalocynthiibacter sp. F2068 TaxID=2926418 RepID=UPI001FF37CC8|nr:helix-turn-helix domain-containing protein [Pseudohalocynthiibacter sp. F2068]MCK0103440.1 helix-turn-helix domain-containing protein [Pseudohalocynthiibacter sp. F2068]
MTRLPSPNKIKTHRIYTVFEAAEALGRHRQTIIRWIKSKGLLADTRHRPWLITGTDLKTYLGYRREQVRCKLALHHLYCLGCKLPQEPAGKFADYTQQAPSTGMLTALCPMCGSVINKIIRRADLEAIRAKIEVTIQQADPRIVSHTDAPLNVTLESEAQSNVKARF